MLLINLTNNVRCCRLILLTTTTTTSALLLLKSKVVKSCNYDDVKNELSDVISDRKPVGSVRELKVVPKFSVDFEWWDSSWIPVGISVDSIEFTVVMETFRRGSDESGFFRTVLHDYPVWNPLKWPGCYPGPKVIWTSILCCEWSTLSGGESVEFIHSSSLGERISPLVQRRRKMACSN